MSTISLDNFQEERKDEDVSRPESGDVNVRLLGRKKIESSKTGSDELQLSLCCIMGNYDYVCVCVDLLDVLYS